MKNIKWPWVTLRRFIEEVLKIDRLREDLQDVKNALGKARLVNFIQIIDYAKTRGRLPSVQPPISLEVLEDRIMALEGSVGGWQDASDKLPPEGRYVLAHLSNDNWGDSTDPEGVYHGWVKLRRGATAEELEKMRSGEMPEDGKEHITAADEWGNNKRPYCWEAFGAATYFGQDVDYWMDVDRVSEPKTEETE